MTYVGGKAPISDHRDAISRPDASSKNHFLQVLICPKGDELLVKGHDRRTAKMYLIRTTTS